jgi:hypothetical protein
MRANAQTLAAAPGFDRAPFCLTRKRPHDKTRALPYMPTMRKWIAFAPLFALLAAAVWFATSSWVHLGGIAIPVYGWFAIAGGVVFSLLVGGGLMALVFYSNRHGYDDLSGGDGGRN